MRTEFHHWPADLLVDYILKTCLPEIEEKLDHIKANFFMLTTFYSSHSPQLLEAERLFLQSSAKITSHLNKEINVILPFVKRYTKELKKEHPSRKPGLSSASAYIHQMYDFHKTENLHFDRIINIMDELSTSNENRYIFEDAYENLFQLKTLWLEEVRLENDVLFPKIVEMEAILYPI